METDRARVIEKLPAILEEFAGILRIPSIASNPKALHECATKISSMLQSRGLEVRLVEQEGAAPLVVGKLNVGAEKTLAIYSHYDGQPVDQLDWINDPWTPTLHAGIAEEGAPRVDSIDDLASADYRLYARCVSDDKAPTQALCSALDLLGDEKPACNLLVITEGEEESSSPNFQNLLAQVPETAQVDAWLICDGPVHPSRRQQVIFGARGVVALQMTVYGPTRTLHSGHFGNWVPNPAMRLVHLIASMRDERGFVTIDGYNDRVKELTSEDERAIAAMPDTDTQLLLEVGVKGPEDGASGMSKSTMRPAINLHGIEAGHVQHEATNAIMQTAHSSMDIRLVPDQTVAQVRKDIEQHVRKQGFHIVTTVPDNETLTNNEKVVRMEWGHGYEPARTPLSSQFAQSLIKAAKLHSEDIVINPMLGGSVPIRKIVAAADRPVAILPIANHDNNQHGANENIRIQNLVDGILLYKTVLKNLTL